MANLKSKRNRVMGVGVNDVNYPVLPRNPDGSQTTCPFYARWKGMLRRCHSSVHKTYSEVYCCEEWKYLSNFRRWMESQNWKNLQLDKDILFPGNKIYSPETCVFVPSYMNSLLVIQLRGDLPLGVTNNPAHKTKPYTAACRQLSSSSKFLGNYETPEEAHRAWQIAKIESLHKAILRYMMEPSYKQEVANAIHLRIDFLESDLIQSKLTMVLD